MDKALKNLITEIACTAGVLWQKGWAERNAGNISVNLAGISLRGLKNPSGKVTCKLAGRYPLLACQSFLVTGTGKKMRDCAADPEDGLCILRLNRAADAYALLWRRDPQVRPTSELNSHLKIHELLVRQKRPEKVVFHTHPTELIAFTHLKGMNRQAAINRALWSMHPEAMMFIPEGAGYVPFKLPGSEALESATVKALEKHRVTIWEKHGVLGVGRSTAEAFDRVDLLNKCAGIFLLCGGAGRKVKGLSPAQVLAIRRAFHPSPASCI
jgi:rhamnulose-1-phosphate aldolase